MMQTDLIVNTNDDPIMKKLNEIRRNHPKSLVFAHVNINSVRSKFHNLADILNAGRIDVLAVTESKLDDSFPMNQFKPRALVSCANGLCYCITPMCDLFIMSDFRTLPSNRLSSFYYIVRQGYATSI